MSLLLAVFTTGGSTIVQADINSSGSGTTSLIGSAIFRGELLSSGQAATNLLASAIANGSVAVAGTGTGSFNSGATAKVVLNSAGVGLFSLAGEDAATGTGYNQVIIGAGKGWTYGWASDSWYINWRTE